MLSSKLYRKGAIKSEYNLPRFAAVDTQGHVAESVPYQLVFKRYWKSLIGTCGAWYGRLSSIIAPFLICSGFYTIL